ncbi:MAG TPA: AMP-binding protein [Dissulfurispiraceae bacterium]|nr:AMP-binding protein [Dissulfurispiraceae bacterium]
MRQSVLERFVSRVDYESYEDFADNFRIIVPDNFNFAYDVVDATAAINPDKVALVWCNDRGAERKFTFAEMKHFSDKAANFFLAQGIRRGDPVMLILKRRFEFWFCILALHKIGAIAIPATHLLTAKDIVYRNNAADIKMIVSVADEAVVTHVDDSVPLSPTLKKRVLVGGKRNGWLDFDSEMERAQSGFVRPSGDAATSNDDILLLYFTSGTTGLPKMVQHDFTYPLGHILTARYWQNVGEDGLHLTVADTGWAKAAWGKIYGQWIAGCAVFVYDYDKFQPGKLLDVVIKYGITSFCAPPTVYRFLIKEDLTKYKFDTLKYGTVAGEPLNPEVYAQFLNATGIRLMEGYGQTESTVAIATYPWLEPKPGSMGNPSPGYCIELLNDKGKPCEIDEEGQIVVRTDKQTPVGMFGGYYRDPDRTANVWHGGIYYTGDVARRDKDGYYWFVGRVDDLIKSSGYRIGPFEVESALIEHPAVLECAITPVADALRGQVVKASVVLARGYVPGERLARELQDHVKKVTAPYKYPRIVEFVDELPKTISGKIRRVEIREKDGK